MALPSATEFQLLAIVNGGEISGREVAKKYHQLTGRYLPYGTVYSTIRRLRIAGWVEVRDDEDQVGRVRMVKITGSGQRALVDARAHFNHLGRFGLSLEPAFS